MKTLTRMRTLAMVLGCLLFLSLACSLGSIMPGASQSSESGDSFSNPAKGLSDLGSYRTVLTQKVSGSLDGKAYERSSQLEITHSGGHLHFIQTVEGTEDPASYFELLTTDQAVYRWYGQSDGCNGEEGQPATGEVIEPVSLLPVLSAHTRVGPETVNGVAAIHYSFTQDQIKVADPKPTASGEVWVAETGGFVVKYLLKVEAVPNPGQDVLSASQEWSYEVDNLNAVAALPLPEGCLPVPVDLPVTADAKEVSRSSGLLSFVTQGSAQSVVDLYMQELPKLGWSPPDRLPTGKIDLPMNLTFMNGELRISLNIDKSDTTGLDVDLAMYRMATPRPTSTPEMPAPPEPTAIAPTADANQSGLPVDVPLYPGSTDMTANGGVVRVTSADSIDTIAAFYSQQMPAQGWTLFQETNTNGSVMQIWQKDDRMFSILISPKDHGLNFITIAQG